uniref:Transmembrane protein n=1 Tax=Iridovirus LCIVAC01 TaxID=2506607 RepID=A0A481YRZ7_9VIRU|nr:MAG: uncharacterized protein LCIVAC01_00350 [Iridovirus LCIVAC01]
MYWIFGILLIGAIVGLVIFILKRKKKSEYKYVYQPIVNQPKQLKAIFSPENNFSEEKNKEIINNKKMSEPDSNKFQNVHEYDTQLTNIFQPERIFSKEEKIRMFKSFQEQIHNPAAQSAITAIIRDLDTNGNYDPANQVDSSDILASILDKELDPSMVNILEEQLSDARNLGICVQGRSTRLIQVWKAIYKF